MITVEAIPTSRFWRLLYHLTFTFAAIADELSFTTTGRYAIPDEDEKACWLDRVFDCADYCEERSGYDFDEA